MGVSSIARDGMASSLGKAGQDITQAFKARLPAVDVDVLYRELLRFKRQQRWWNLRFDASAIRSALHGENYTIFGLLSVLDLRSNADLARLNRIAATVVRRLFENAYRKREAQSSRYRLIGAEHSGIPASYRKEVTVK